MKRRKLLKERGYKKAFDEISSFRSNFKEARDEISALKNNFEEACHKISKKNKIKFIKTWKIPIEPLITVFLSVFTINEST